MTIEEKKDILERIALIQRDTFGECCGIRCELAEDDAPELYFEIGPMHLNPGRSVHGGMLFTLIDNAAGITARVRHGFKGSLVTQTASIHYLRPPTAGILRAKTTPVHEGRQTGLYRVDVLDESGDTVCCGEVTMFFLSD